MRDLNYALKQLCQRNRDGSFATQADREHLLDQIADQLHEMGFRHMDAHSLKPKHVENLIERWLAEKLSPGTVKNRMTALRWWAEKIGKQNVVARTNAAYGIPDRVYVTNLSKAKDLVAQQQAVVRWCQEKAHKATAVEDRRKFQWLDQFFRGRLLHTITRDEVQAIGEAKARQSSRATANRYLALIRAVLRRAAGPWQWIEKAPAISLYPEAKRRVRWLTKEEATRLLAALAPHQRRLMRFALATGLRQSNVLHLKWSQVDLERRTAWIHADEAKAREAIGVPLNDEAMAVLREERGKHPTSVFTFHRRPLKSVNTKAWKKALKRAGIENFRWHDLRHVWATWHVMAGTTLGELQELGAWKSETMVKRYAHFAPEQLRRAADRLATFWSTETNTGCGRSTQPVDSW